MYWFAATRYKPRDSATETILAKGAKSPLAHFVSYGGIPSAKGEK